MGSAPENCAQFGEHRVKASEHNGHGILLALDEVQTGYGRTGRFWGHHRYPIADAAERGAELIEGARKIGANTPATGDVRGIG